MKTPNGLTRSPKKRAAIRTLLYSSRPTNGGRELADDLNIRKGLADGPKFVGNLINWGSTELPPRFSQARVFNKPSVIRQTSNKLSFFKLLEGKDITPPFYTSKAEAEKVFKKSTRIVCRTILNGSSGDGIIVAHSPDELVRAPLYTLYIPKDSEWRIHVFKMKKGLSVIDIQKKARRQDVSDEEVNWEVRNLDGGFIYKRNDIEAPQCVLDVATKCMSYFDLDFGAVDVIYNKKSNKAYALEINSAPGLEGTTVLNYATAFKEMINDI